MEKLSSFSGGNHMGDDLGYCQFIFFFAVLCIEDAVFLMFESYTSEAITTSDTLITIGYVLRVSSTFSTEEDIVGIFTDGHRFINIFAINSPDIVVVAILGIVETGGVFEIFAGTDLVREDAILRIREVTTV